MPMETEKMQILEMIAQGKITAGEGEQLLDALAASDPQPKAVPPRFLAKIFQALAKAGIVKSHRGAKGGFSLGRPAVEITVPGPNTAATPASCRNA